MAYVINVRKFDPSPEQQRMAKGRLPTKWGMSVAGGWMDFRDEKVRNLLAENGFVRSNKERDSILWTLQASIAPLPLHIVDMLKFFGKVKPSKDVQQRLDVALGMKASQTEMAFEDINFFGGGAETGPSGGRGPIKVGAIGDGMIIASCNKVDGPRRAFLEAAGFQPKPLSFSNPKHAAIIARYGDEPWVTTESVMARNLSPLMDGPTRLIFRGMRLRDEARLAESKTIEAPGNGFRVPVPPALSALGKTPYDFQHTGVFNVTRSGPKARRGGIIGDDMGLGKSIQLAGVISVEKNARKILVICKSNMKLKLADEISDWCWRGEDTPIPPIKVLTGKSDEFDIDDPGILIMNYEIAVHYRERLELVEWDIIAADEAQNISNAEAGRTQAILGNVKVGVLPLKVAEGGIVVLMTGTLPARVERLYTLLSAVRPDLFGSDEEARRRFMNRYCPPQLIARRYLKTGVPATTGVDERGQPVPTEMTDDNSFVRLIPLEGDIVRVGELYRRMRESGTLTARLKTQLVGILPEKSRYPIKLPIRITPEIEEMLRDAEIEMDRIAEKVADESQMAGLVATKGSAEHAGRVIDIIAGIPKSSPEFYEISRLRKRLAILKAPYVARYVIDECEEEDAGGGLTPEERPKLVIAGHHKEALAIIRDDLERRYPGSTLLYDGSVTSDKKRKQIVEDFQTNPRKRFILLSLSGSTGITLTAAYRLYAAEMFWDPTDQAQMEDRIYRLGQEMPCEIGYMFVANSYDLRVGMVMIRKMEILNQLYHAPDLTGKTISQSVSQFRKARERGELSMTGV